MKEKVGILCKLNTRKASKFEIAKKYEIAESMLSTYVQNEKTTEDTYEAEAVASERKRLRSAEHPDLDRAFNTWAKDTRSQDLPLSGPIVVAEAAEFAIRPNNYGFVASTKGTILSFCTGSGGSKEVIVETCLMWRTGTLQDYLDSY